MVITSLRVRLFVIPTRPPPPWNEQVSRPELRVFHFLVEGSENQSPRGRMATAAKRLSSWERIEYDPELDLREPGTMTNLSAKIVEAPLPLLCALIDPTAPRGPRVKLDCNQISDLLWAAGRFLGCEPTVHNTGPLQLSAQTRGVGRNPGDLGHLRHHRVVMLEGAVYDAAFHVGDTNEPALEWTEVPAVHLSPVEYFKRIDRRDQHGWRTTESLGEPVHTTILRGDILRPRQGNIRAFEQQLRKEGADDLANVVAHIRTNQLPILLLAASVDEVADVLAVEFIGETFLVRATRETGADERPQDAIQTVIKSSPNDDPFRLRALPSEVGRLVPSRTDDALLHYFEEALR